ncbi:MAG: glycoside hydrolase family 88 protein [Clostridia bacterium]
MTYEEAYKLCGEKARLHMKSMNGIPFELGECRDGDYYKHVKDKEKSALSGRWSWVTSFVTGMAPLLFQTDGDSRALRWANQFADDYHDKVFRPYTQTMHDLGFLYLPYSVHMYQLTGDRGHRDTALQAANELAKRFDLNGRYIEAWSEMNTFEKDGRMIIDSCMNLPLLFWAWKETGHTFYHDVAAAHLETAMRVLVREDASVCHAWRLDPATGQPTEEVNSCGFANGSHWARGTGWMVFGLAIAYEYTKNETYLDTAVKVAEKYLDSLEDSPVPVWDFRLPADQPAKICGNVPGLDADWDESLPENKKYNVDTSAAAIMACGLQTIERYRPCDRFHQYVEAALSVLSNEYLNTNPTVPGMLSRCNGRNAFSIYGDYYYMLALAMRLYDVRTCWGCSEDAPAVNQ